MFFGITSSRIGEVSRSRRQRLRSAIATARLASFWPTMKRSSSETISRGEKSVIRGFRARDSCWCRRRFRPRSASRGERSPRRPVPSAAARAPRRARNCRRSRSRSPSRCASPSGSSTSPEPLSTKPTLLSATSSIASRRLRYRSMRQSLPSSTQARGNWPGYCSSLDSSRSNRVSASAVDPAKPAITSPLASRRNLRALPFMMVWPTLTCPSPPRTTLLPLRTIRIVVACHPGPALSLISLFSPAFGGKRTIYGRNGPGARALGLSTPGEFVDPDRVGPGAPARHGGIRSLIDAGTGAQRHRGTRSCPRPPISVLHAALSRL